MNQKINKNRFLIHTILIFVFSLLSISAPAQTYVWAQSNNDQLLHIDEKRKIYEVSTKQAERTASKKQNQNRYMLIPGGDAIGIKIQTDGLVVVDTYLVNTEGGTINPAKEAGVMKGDMILAVNNQKISTIEEYKEQLMLAKENNQMILTIDRQGKTENITVHPVISTEGVCTTGLYLRDKLAGIGTLTFIDPNTNKYGALGHEIIDQDTNQLVNIKNGEIINSNVLSVRKATTGKPGEKVADILFDEKLGTLEKNNKYGVYGLMQSNEMSQKDLIPMAYINEVKKGPAQILTVLNGNKIEAFDIEITEVNVQSEKAIKGIKYTVTDPRLLEETGGIVQGMSGSPIIQDGKIIGAVTHVLVHDSTLGYGIFIEWMLQEVGIEYPAQKMVTKVA
ncbi:SpoIVB peptidase [Turicibacter sp. 1E2]|uniref:SpoIVB peptidase n=1 Tax=Turicibacter sp. 1E2 TaxID=2951143 RepID=UPI0021D5187E|nr:SpoIVB peptidase [Turicibacter sp. 1E2]MCU7208881.1 SpoIVB peptidase [Turicibacter sp. 1E2]